MKRDDQRELARLLRSRHACIIVHTVEEDEALELAAHVAIDERADMLLWSANTGVRSGLIEHDDPVPETSHPAAALCYFAERCKAGLCVMVDLAHHLQDPGTLRQLREAIRSCARAGRTLVLIDHAERFPPVIEAHAVRFDLAMPGEKEIASIVRAVVRQEHDLLPVNVKLSKAQLGVMVKNLAGLTRRQIRQVVREAIAEDRTLDERDINHMLAGKRRALGADGLLEYIETPAALDEIGGMARLKRWLRVREPAIHAESEDGLEPPRGVLLLGVQGAGKSMCAKAIATGWHRPLLRMDPGTLYDRYVGESERRLREALRRAEAMAPVVLWIDEIEKGFASAAGQSTDGGLSRRMFGTLLTWMQDHRAPVFMVATANDIEALPPELLRKGRFDEIFFVDLPTAAVRGQIFSIHLKKRGQDPEAFDVDALAKASEGFSGAEIEQAVLAGLHEARARKAALDTDMLREVIETSPPLSVTMAERVAALRRWAEGRCVPAE